MMERRNDSDLPSASGPGPDGGLASSGASPEIEGYEIKGPLGEGGMGTVWRAVQLSTRREVALKFLGKGTFISQKAHLRFEREVELTARLQHPNIARIYESGLRHGVYYYAMELIDGIPLDKYVEARRLTQRQVLELTRLVCDAVQHAHQHGVIHRDLKPSNILVSEDGQPHVLDFGLAKASLEEGSGAAASTDGETPGTPAYMSPEQAAGHSEQVDTRADVYAIGVMLYRLLTGQSPHDLSGTRYEVLRRIAEEEVRRPRDTTKNVDRELEALLLKALAHDPKDRYSSAGALALDIQNYLNGEPLTARPPSTVYFLRKRIRKYRLPIAVACCVLAALVIVCIFAYVRVVQERAKVAAEGQKAKAVQKFVESILTSFDPAKAHRQQITIREALDQAAGDLSTKLSKQPEVEGPVRDTIGRVYLALGQFNAAEVQFSRALEIRRRIKGSDHPDTLGSMNNLAIALGEQGKTDQAVILHRRVFETRRRVLGNAHADTLASMNGLAIATQRKGRIDEAEAMHRQILEARKRILGKQHPDTLASMNNLAALLFEKGRIEEAEAIFWQVFNVHRQQRGEEHPDTLVAMSNIGHTLLEEGDTDEAETMLRKVLDTRLRLLGEDHPDALSSMKNMAAALWRAGKLDEAETMLGQCLEIQRRRLGEDHPDTLDSMRNLTFIREERDKYSGTDGSLLAYDGV